MKAFNMGAVENKKKKKKKMDEGQKKFTKALKRAAKNLQTPEYRTENGVIVIDE